MDGGAGHENGAKKEEDQIEHVATLLERYVALLERYVALLERYVALLGIRHELAGWGWPRGRRDKTHKLCHKISLGWLAPIVTVLSCINCMNCVLCTFCFD